MKENAKKPYHGKQPIKEKEAYDFFFYENLLCVACSSGFNSLDFFFELNEFRHSNKVIMISLGS